MKTRLGISSLLLLLLCLSCDKDISLVLEPPINKTPELLPLTEGASWEYHFYYNYSVFGSIGLEVQDTLSGKYTLSVSKRKVLGDSVIFSLQAVTLENGSTVPVTEIYQIIQYGDSLWFQSEVIDNPQYLMPLKFTESAGINVEMFIPKIIRSEKIFVAGTYLEQIRKLDNNVFEYTHYTNPGGSGISYIRAYLKESGLYWIHYQAYYGPRSQIKDISLIDYTPGTP